MPEIEDAPRRPAALVPSPSAVDSGLVEGKPHVGAHLAATGERAPTADLGSGRQRPPRKEAGTRRQRKAA